MVVILYLGCIVLANLLVQYFGIISFLGLVFPAGAIMVGLSFTLRDLVQRKYGKYICWIWMIVALLITVLFSKEIALASGIAFLIAETIDWVVYTYTKYSIKKRIIFSNLISIPFDSLIFVPLIFGWVFPAIIGQMIVKFICSFCILPFLKNELK